MAKKVAKKEAEFGTPSKPVHVQKEPFNNFTRGSQGQSMKKGGTTKRKK